MSDRNLAFLGGIAVGIVLLVLSWLIVSPNSGSGGGTDQARLSGERSPSATPSATASAQLRPQPDRMQRCIDAATELKRPLRRAASSVDQWEVHVGAMNKLVVGAISLRQANAFWSQTRVGAHHLVAEFERASARLQRHGVDCPQPTLLPSGSSPQLRSCARQVAADVRVLDAARTAIGTWRRHVRDMDMLRMGKMTPVTAGRMWLAMWQRGQHEIDSYREAARAARGDFGCPSAAPTPSASRSP